MITARLRLQQIKIVIFYYNYYDDEMLFILFFVYTVLKYKQLVI